MFVGSFGNLITKLEETVYPQLLNSKFKILFLWYIIISSSKYTEILKVDRSIDFK